MLPNLSGQGQTKEYWLNKVPGTIYEKILKKSQIFPYSARLVGLGISLDLGVSEYFVICEYNKNLLDRNMIINEMIFYSKSAKNVILILKSRWFDI